MSVEFVPFGAATPPKKKELCHSVPTFGCETCIMADREAWAKKTYEVWAAKYNKAPKLCPRHKQPLKPFTYHFQDGPKGKLIGIAGCQVLTAQGEFLCEDEDDCVVIG